MVRLGRGPEAVAAADHPVGLARAAHLLLEFDEHVGPVVRRITDDARPDIEREHQFVSSATQTQVVLPAPDRRFRRSWGKEASGPGPG